MTQEVRSLLKERDAAFRSGDGTQCGAAKLRRGIREAKRKIEGRFSSTGAGAIIKKAQQSLNFLRLLRKNKTLMSKEHSHHGHRLLELLASGRRYWTFNTRKQLSPHSGMGT